MNKAYAYSDLKDKRVQKNAEFHKASASTERFSSLIFKSVDSNFQKIEPELPKYSLSVNFEDSLGRMTIDGEEVHPGVGENNKFLNATIEVTQESTVEIKIATDWYIRNQSNCYVNRTNGSYAQPLSVYGINSNSASIEIWEDIDVTDRITVTNGKILVAEQTTPISSYQYRGKFSNATSFSFTIVPDEGYRLVETPTATGVNYIKNDDGSYFVDFTENRNDGTLAFTCEVATVPVTDIPINFTAPSGALSNLVINGTTMADNNSGSTVVKSNVSSFTVSYSMANNYTLSSVKVNGTAVSFTQAGFTVNLDDSNSYSIAFVATYTAPVTYRTIHISGLNDLDVTATTPVPTDPSQNFSNYTYDFKYPDSNTSFNFNVAVKEPNKVEIKGVTTNNGNASFSEGVLTLTNVTSADVTVTFTVERIEAEMPKYTYTVKYDNAYSTYLDKYEYYFESSNPLNTFNEEITSESQQIFVNFKTKSAYASNYAINVTIANSSMGTIVRGADGIYCITANDATVPVEINVSVTTVVDEKYYVTMTYPSGCSLLCLTPAFDVTKIWTSGSRKSFDYESFFKDGSYILKFALDDNDPQEGKRIKCAVNGVEQTGTVNNKTYVYEYTISSSIHNYAVELVRTDEAPVTPPTTDDYNVTIAVGDTEQIVSATFNGTDYTSAIKTDGSASATITNSTANYSFTVTDEYDVETITANGNPITDFTRNGRNVSGVIDLSQYGTDVAFDVIAKKTLHTLTFANNGRTYKWNETTIDGKTYYQTYGVLPNTISSVNISYGIGFIVPNDSNIRYLKLEFDATKHRAKDESLFYIKASDTLYNQDQRGASIESGEFSNGANDYHKVLSENVSLNVSTQTVTIDLKQIKTDQGKDASNYNYIYVGFANFYHTQSSNQRIVIKNYQYREDVSGLDIGTASTSDADGGFFDGSVIVDGNVIQECDPTGETIPYNSYSFTIIDEDNSYSPLTGEKFNRFKKYQEFEIYGVVKDYEGLGMIADSSDGLYGTQIARCKFNGIEYNNGLATFNFIGTLEYYDNIQLSEDEKQKYCSHTRRTKVSDFLQGIFGSDVNLDRFDNSKNYFYQNMGDYYLPIQLDEPMKVFSDADKIVIPFEDETKTEIAKIIAQAFGMFIFEDNEGKIRFHTLGDKFDSTSSEPFKLTLDQNFSNPTVTMDNEEVDSVDFTYHNYILDGLEEIKFSSVEKFYHIKDGSSSFDCRMNDGYVLYSIASEEEQKNIDQYQNYVQGSVLDEIDEEIDFIKIRFNFGKKYSVNSLRFLTDTKTIFQIDDDFYNNQVKKGSETRKKNNLEFEDLRNVFLSCWSQASVVLATNRLYAKTYDLLPEKGTWGSYYLDKSNYPCAIVTEEHVDLIFRYTKDNNLCNYYTDPFFNQKVIIDGEEKSNGNVWFAYTISAYLLLSGAKGKPISDKPIVYYHRPFGTHNRTINMDIPIITEETDAKSVSSMIVSNYKNNLYEINNDWKGDCTVAVGDTILNGLPIGGYGLSNRTCENYKPALVKYNNYTLNDGLTCDTKISMPKNLFYELENKNMDVLIKTNSEGSTKNFKFSSTKPTFKV